MMKAIITLLLISCCSLVHAYEKDGSVITKRTGGGTVAVDTSIPNSAERTAAPSEILPTETATTAPAERAIAGKTGKTKRTETVVTGGESPQAYTSGGGVQSPGGEKTCHVRGFKDPSGLIHDDHYQKCGTIINGMTSQCYADGRCRISY